MALVRAVLRAVSSAPAARCSASALAANALRASGARAFSGNVEYPRIEGSVADITKALNTIGARLSIPTAALYLTEAKINHVVREMKGADELREVQRALLLCDAKLVYPSAYASGTFVSACLKQDAPELALEWLQKAENARRYVSNQSVVRLAKYFAEHDDQEQVEALWKLMADKGIAPTTKTFHFRVVNAKNQGKFDDAVAIAKEAAELRQINSNLIIQLLNGLEGDALKQQVRRARIVHVSSDGCWLDTRTNDDVCMQIPLAKYLAAKGEVHVNARLAELLADQ